MRKLLRARPDIGVSVKPTSIELQVDYCRESMTPTEAAELGVKLLAAAQEAGISTEAFPTK